MVECSTDSLERCISFINLFIDCFTRWLLKPKRHLDFFTNGRPDFCGLVHSNRVTLFGTRDAAAVFSPTSSFVLAVAAVWTIFFCFFFPKRNKNNENLHV